MSLRLDVLRQWRLFIKMATDWQVSEVGDTCRPAPGPRSRRSVQIEWISAGTVHLGFPALLSAPPPPPHLLSREIKMNRRHLFFETRAYYNQPVILWIELDGKPKWLPLNFGYDGQMCTVCIAELPLYFPDRQLMFMSTSNCGLCRTSSWTHHNALGRSGSSSKLWVLVCADGMRLLQQLQNVFDSFAHYLMLWPMTMFSPKRMSFHKNFWLLIVSIAAVVQNIDFGWVF